MTLTATQSIAQDLAGDLTDPNHIVRRHFSLWIEGSYKGEEHRAANLRSIDVTRDGAGEYHTASPKALRTFIISEFTKFTAADAYCSYGHAQKSIVAALSKDALAQLTKDLTADCVEWAIDQTADEVAA